MAYLVRCPTCRYPKRIDAVEDYELAGCPNALCGVAFLTRVDGWTSPAFTLLYPDGKRVVTYDLYVQFLDARERAFREMAHEFPGVVTGVDLAIEADRTLVATWFKDGEQLRHVKTETL